MRRVNIVGVPGAGKSTFASVLSRKTGVPLVALDQLYWLPNWQPRNDTEFRDLLSEATSGSCWIVDGNYRAWRSIFIGQVDTIIWLDYSLPLVLWRVVKRTAKRLLSREIVCNGNRERFSTQFTRESVLVQTFKNHFKYHSAYPSYMEEMQGKGVTCVRLTSPQMAARFLDTIDSEPSKSDRHN